MSKTVLCADNISLQNPELLGLEGERLENQEWLSLFSDPFEVREEIRKAHLIDEVWVFSSDSVEGINVAAALKCDAPDMQISFVTFDSSGSVLGRAEAAGLECIMGKNAFVARYSRRKQEAFAEAGAPNRSMVSWSTKPAETSRDVNEKVESAEVQPIPMPVSKNSEKLQRSNRDFFALKALIRPMQEKAPGEMELDEPLVPERKAFAKQAPEESAALESTAKRILESTLAQVGTGRESYVLTVASGSGGCGKSTIATMTALAMQAAGKKTLLLDADLQFGDAKFNLGVENALDIGDILSNPERVLSLDAKPGFPALIASPVRLEYSEIISRRMTDLIAYLRDYYDVIVVNTGAFWSELHAQLIEASDSTVFVLDQRPSSIRACNHALELCARCGIATQAFHFVLNFCSRSALLTSMDVSCSLRGAKVFELKDGGTEVGELLSAGIPLELLNANNAFCSSLRDFLLTLFPDLTPDRKSTPARKKPKRFAFPSRGRRVACL